ncbi:DUF6153 family protein [Streptomyces sp. BP-8]|uniref:DUF6153 family protein n=1 Tax=Streptomyces sirii TaxID=3127701 RepID=A0ABZ2QM10_9ACTN
MRQHSRRTARPPAARARVLLVLAVLAGVLAMHGLAPAVPPASAHAAPAAHHAAPAALPAHTEAAGCGDCPHAHHGGAGGHAQHADGTCAAGGTSAAPVLPAPAPAGTATCVSAAAPVAAPAASLGGRAPPSLSELQLLRI